jgi:RNA polymerase sigma-70 factor (ECF subfamily)
MPEVMIMITKVQEARLLSEARQGDQDAFAALVSPLRDRIYWRAVKAVRDLDQADDITQETLLRAFTRLDTFRGDARFSSWLYMVASNCIRMHLRTRRRRGALRLEDHLSQVETSNHSAIDIPLKLPDEIAINDQMFEAIDSAMSQLPPQYGSILRLWVEDGLDLKEIEAQSGLSVAAIKSRLHRARRRLRDFLDAEYGEGALLAA